MQIEGHVRIEKKLPDIAFAEEAIFIPAGNGHRGGLYDTQLNPISQAVSCRGDLAWLSSPIAKRIDLDALPMKQSNAPYFFIGGLYPHFGHCLLESTARLWPLLYLPPSFAGKYLYCGKHAASTCFEKKFIKDIFGCFSLEVNDFVTYHKPCRLKNVFVAAPSFEVRLQGYPIFRQTMQYIGDTLANGLAQLNNTNLTPVYLSKSKLVNGVHGIINELAIEDSLRNKGVDIWHPETVALSAQIREMTSRKYIMGTVGSAFHTLLCCPGNKAISGVVKDTVINSNYLIIDKLCGNTGRYEPGNSMGIHLAQDVTADTPSRFIHSFYAANPDRVAETLLRNINL
ncbi:MAG: glycosyltransferase family 61 protein [Methylovulum sp.]|nr:glycosyltransferase family 61 protein [Methylovulum sp.]